MLKIGDFSKLSRITVRMLRHYDEMDLIKPQFVDEWTGELVRIKIVVILFESAEFFICYFYVRSVL